jgi:hypothetical protein
MRLFSVGAVLLAAASAAVVAVDQGRADEEPTRRSTATSGPSSTTIPPFVSSCRLGDHPWVVVRIVRGPGETPIVGPAPTSRASVAAREAEFWRIQRGEDATARTPDVCGLPASTAEVVVLGRSTTSEEACAAWRRVRVGRQPPSGGSGEWVVRRIDRPEDLFTVAGPEERCPEDTTGDAAGTGSDSGASSAPADAPEDEMEDE